MFLGLTVSLGLIYNEGVQLVANGEIEIGNIIQVFQLSIQIITAFFGIGILGGLLAIFGQSYKRIKEIMNLEEIKKIGNEPINSLIDKEIKFENVNLSIDNNAILQGLNFTILPGKTNAIIGNNGCGKTVIASLLMKNMEPTSGRIMIGNKPLSTIDIDEYRKHVSIAMQENYIFSGTIESNFRFVKENLTEDEIRRTIQYASMEDFALNKDGDVASLNIVNGGTNISGGQKQRIAIANALIKDADLFIMDNIFSSLDTITINKIKESFSKYFSSKTILLLSQRVSDVKDAENIIVMENGRVVAQGNHKYLKEFCPVYRDYINSQIKEGI